MNFNWFPPWCRNHASRGGIFTIFTLSTVKNSNMILLKANASFTSTQTSLDKLAQKTKLICEAHNLKFVLYSDNGHGVPVEQFNCSTTV